MSACGQLAGQTLHVPHLIDSEVTSALRGLVTGRRLDATYAALAEALGYALLTGDARLSRARGSGAR